MPTSSGGDGDTCLAIGNHATALSICRIITGGDVLRHLLLDHVSVEGLVYVLAQ